MQDLTIIEKAKRLKDIIASLNANLLADKPSEDLINEYKEYLELKKSIKLDYIEKHGMAFQEDFYEQNEKWLKFIQDISLGNDPEVESKFKSKLLVRFFKKNWNPNKGYNNLEEFISDLSSEDLEELDFLEMTDDLTFEEEDELAKELISDWFSVYDYVRGLYNAGILIARVGSLPPFLTEFLKEVRECFAFQRHLAVCALSRTILEISIRDLYNLVGFNDPESQEHAIAENYFFQKKKGKKWKYPDEYNISLNDMRNLLCKLPEYEHFHQEIGDLNVEMNRVIHGNKTTTRKEAETIFKKTLELVHNLYEV